jgi:hypothetical protein
MKQNDPNEKQPFFGPNAKPFFIQMAFVLLLAIFVAPHLKRWIGDGLCAGFNFCSSEQLAHQNASTGQ